MTPDEMSTVFAEWNKGELNSYLIEITADILRKKDEDGLPLIDKILDTAGQKGTGKWTAVSSLDEGVPLSLITEAVYARTLSAQKNERVEASKVYQRSIKQYTGDKQEFLDQLKDTLYVAKILSYAQGFVLLQEASKTYHWNLNYGNIALLWRGGCIIRSAFLGKINEGFHANPQLSNLLLDPYFKSQLDSRIDSYREVLAIGILCGLPTPSLGAGLHYFDGYTTENLPANLLQAMRDYFGAHTYERIDKPRGEFFHTNWTGKGGSTSSTTYNV
jgi:6-phosphogluconate dehydrogenase